MKFNNICDSFDYAAAIDIFNGERHSLSGVDFDKALCAAKEVFDEGFQMPAFGVSVHDYTTALMETETWLEFRFGQQCESFGMAFEGLLIFIKPEYQSCDIIRLYENKYQGRCFHVQLKNTMQPLYDAVISID